MPASLIDDIRPDQIETTIHEARRIWNVTINYWRDHSESDIEKWESAALRKLTHLEYEDVVAALQNEISGDSPVDEILMAICIAIEPEDMPDDCVIDLEYLLN